MSDQPSGDRALSHRPIALTVEDDGQVMIAAAEVVDWLREISELYGAGEFGGTRVLRKGAHDALAAAADSLQSAYVEVAADGLIDTWWRS